MRDPEPDVMSELPGGHELREREILEVAERERQRLGRELHDGLCQSLTGIAALAAALSKNLAADNKTDPAAAADEIVGLLREAIDEARDLARSIVPIDPNGGGLPCRLGTLAHKVSRAHRISCSFACVHSCSAFSGATETHLLRIAQEAVHNAITHGRADQIQISLECVNGSGLLSIRDNGVGFSEDCRNHGGIGLNTMDFRARAIGGSLTMARQTDSGMIVTCAFPLPAAPELLEGAKHDFWSG